MPSRALAGECPESHESLVTAEALEAALAEVTADCDPVAGPFGPGSMIWTVGRETALVFGGTRSVLLQLAHPFVAESLKYVSGPGRNVRSRFIATMHYCSAMTFGDRDHVLKAARRVFAIHERVGGVLDVDAGAFPRGTRFRANEVEALWWVASTLWDSSVVAFETFVRPLSLEEKNGYLRDCRRWSRLFGIPESAMSPDWPAFERYVREMVSSDVLTVTELGQRAAGAVVRSPRRITEPLFAWNRILTAGMLPPRMRREFGLPFGSREERIFRTSVRLLRPLFRTLPPTLRYNPKYVLAMRRLGGKSRNHPISEAMSGLVKTVLR